MPHAKYMHLNLEKNEALFMVWTVSKRNKHIEDVIGFFHIFFYINWENNQQQ